jgi:predicted chitinase
MTTYFDNLTAEQKGNIKFIIQKMNEKGITNPITQSAILAVVSKESAFIPRSESQL